MAYRNAADDYIDSLLLEGTIAYENGEDITNNPYDHGTPEHEYWAGGWQEASNNDK